MSLMSAVLAYRVLKSFNLSNEEQQLARATLTDVTYGNKKIPSEPSYFRKMGVSRKQRTPDFPKNEHFLPRDTKQSTPNFPKNEHFLPFDTLSFALLPYYRRVTLC